MSKITFTKQTPWEETPEEVQRRIQQSQAKQTGWFGTVIGLTLAAGALVMLLLES